MPPVLKSIFIFRTLTPNDYIGKFRHHPSHPKSGPKAPISGGPQRAKRVMEHPKGGFLKKRQNDHHEQDTVHIPLLMMTRWLGKVIACVFFVRISHVLGQLL